MKRWILLSALLLSGSIAQGAELLINGDFEEALDVGWETLLVGDGASVDRGQDYDLDLDYEAHTRKLTGIGQATLTQTRMIPSPNVDFTARICPHAVASGTAWAAAGVGLSYLDENNHVLGQTRICARTAYCTWTNGPTSHLIVAPDNSWSTHAFSLEDELVNLPGIEPNAIVRVRVEVFSYVNHC